MSVVASVNFKGVPVAASAGKEPLIYKSEFYQALVDSLGTRLFPESEKTLSQAIEVLDVAAVANEVPPEFGEPQLKLLYATFGCSFNEAKNAYRDFKDSGGKVVPDSLKKVIHLAATIPVSTAACERGFSRMNLVCS